MLKTLIKKQFFECFKGYFISTKTGKAKSKAGIIGMFVLFISILLFLSFSFVAISLEICTLLPKEYSWLNYALLGIISIALGLFATVFNTSNALYNAKDNDLLLSMPIKPSYVLISRVSLVYGLALIYMSVVWLPACIVPLIVYKFNPLLIIVDIVLLLILALFVSVLCCGFGYVVAFITNKTKNKSLITVLLTLIFLGAYYFVCFRFESMINTILENTDAFANTITTWFNLIYQLALAANGNILSFIIFTIVTLVLAVICFYILKSSYYKIISNSNKVSVTRTKIEYKTKSNIQSILLAKEFKRFFSLPIYLMNCGLGSAFVIVAAIAVVIKRNDISSLIMVLDAINPNLVNYIPLGIVVIICMIQAINNIATPSISLEGKNLWILKSLPINTIDILNAKKQLQFIFNVVPAILSAIVISIVLKLEYSLIIYICVCIMLIIEMNACIGSIFSLVNPNFNWTSETQPIKQAMNILYAMVVNLLLIVVIVGLCILTRDIIDVSEYFEYLVVVLIVGTILLRKLINTWGVKTFERL